MTALFVEGLTVRYGDVTVAEGVDLEVASGTIHGLVGESGSGKSSLARGIVGLASARGRVMLDGIDVSNCRVGERGIQMVFQNPYASLNPRMTIHETIVEAAAAHGQKDTNPTKLLELVGLRVDAGGRFPHQFSGGQRQRIAIARALATRASVIILDEVTSALDVSVQATILNLLRELQRSEGIAFLFISHDLLRSAI